MKTSFRVAAGLLATSAVGLMPATAQVTAQVNDVSYRLVSTMKQQYRSNNRGFPDVSPPVFRDIIGSVRGSCVYRLGDELFIETRRGQQIYEWMRPSTLPYTSSSCYPKTTHSL